MSTPRFESDRYFLHPQISLLSTPSPATMSVGCQGRSSNSRMPSVIRWLVLTYNLCNANHFYWRSWRE
ncbi:hypothetical protein [Nostoc favosum]|uniref:Uncharacterized protein n=1 Tax=Nostoc favosum CHAB5714 TaxID=2780399 RepID=A0ABS8I9L0_9NOSO|nr:hypothetical protein [Nostoc favosum]MCC5600895.1 hypothetical protein [Nostoc favosum CHAB5714]